MRNALIKTNIEPKVFSDYSYELSPYGWTKIATPITQIDKLINSCFDILSPKNKKAIIVAKRGEVLLRKANLDRDISFTAVLNIKNVIVPVIDLIITNFH